MLKNVKLIPLLCIVAALGAHARAQQTRLPVIDVHLHANPVSDFLGGGPACTNDQKIIFLGWDPKEPLSFERLMSCPEPIKSPTTDEGVMEGSLQMLDKYNIWAVTMGRPDMVKLWRERAKGRIIPAANFSSRSIPTGDYRRLFKQGEFSVFAEVGPQYRGLALGDEAYDDDFALAEELDIPVGVHLGEDPVGGAHTMGGPSSSLNRARLTSPHQLEEVLVRHPAYAFTSCTTARRGCPLLRARTRGEDRGHAGRQITAPSDASAGIWRPGQTTVKRRTCISTALKTRRRDT